MHKKFLVFINRKFEPVIVLDNVRFHKEINFPESFGKPAVRCGGGWWDVNNGVLKLYDDSVDFGKYDSKTAKRLLKSTMCTTVIRMYFVSFA